MGKSLSLEQLCTKNSATCSTTNCIVRKSYKLIIKE